MRTKQQVRWARNCQCCKANPTGQDQLLICQYSSTEGRGKLTGSSQGESVEVAQIEDTSFEEASALKVSPSTSLPAFKATHR